MQRSILVPSPAPAASDDDWDSAEPSSRTLTAETTLNMAMRSLQLVPPPPAQDGGAYEPMAAASDASGQALARGFDPYAQPVSPAVASAASAMYGPLDPVLVACLENPRERLTLLKFEDQIVRFLRGSREPQLVFPPLSSYHRLIIHRLAQRCFLDHQTAEYNPYAQGYESNSARAVTLFKTAQTAIPSVLLIDLSTDRQQPTITPASAPKIMMRKRGASRPGANGGRGNGDGKTTRSMQDREKAYAEARARIFGEESPSTSSTTTDSTSSDNGPKLATQQASGPDGSKGFGGRGGRGKPQERGASPSGANRSDQAQPDRRASDAESRNEPPIRTQNWKESKVLWRNREQELNDPDFTRNHDAYRPVRTGNESPFGGNNRYQATGRQQQQSDYYDQRSYGYHGTQPPLPGRRPGGEYSRVDNMRPPPPPEQQYRGGGMVPSQFGGGRPYAYSPHSRSQYTQPPARHAPATGGYNDDFPPLGQ